MSRRLLLLLPMVTLSCLGTPVPIPTPIETREVRLSSPASDGSVLLVGLSGAMAVGDEVSIVNHGRGERWQAPAALTGSFGALIRAQTGDELELRARSGAQESLPVLLVVGPGSGRPAPLLQVGPPDQGGQVLVSGLASGTVLFVVPRTGQVLAARPGPDARLSATLSAGLEDAIGGFAVDAGGTGSVHRMLRVAAQGDGDCLDHDQDGFGLPGSLLQPCRPSQTPQPDCDDGSAEVFPGQPRFFPSAIPGQGGFDYNCNGQEDRQLTEVVANCAVVVPKLCEGSGWKGAVPGCGEVGAWVGCVLSGSQCIEQDQGTRVQACR